MILRPRGIEPVWIAGTRALRCTECGRAWRVLQYTERSGQFLNDHLAAHGLYNPAARSEVPAGVQDRLVEDQP